MIIFDADDPLVLNGTYDCEGWKPGERERSEKAKARQAKEESMAKSKKRERSKKPAVKAQSNGAKPRERSLPGMEDHAIPALERIAARYADIRDQRMELTQDKVKLKGEARKLMHQHGKTTYKHGGIEIRLVPGEEDVKVKIRQPKDDEDGVTASPEEAVQSTPVETETPAEPMLV